MRFCDLYILFRSHRVGLGIERENSISSFDTPKTREWQTGEAY